MRNLESQKRTFRPLTPPPEEEPAVAPEELPSTPPPKRRALDPPGAPVRATATVHPARDIVVVHRVVFDD